MLVVDDDADTRELAVLGLERAGAEVVAVGTFARAKDTLERMRFDAIVSDVHIVGEEVDGLAFARAIRSSPEWDSIALVGVSAQGGSIGVTLALEAGFDAYLVKPVALDALLDAVVAGAETRRRR